MVSAWPFVGRSVEVAEVAAAIRSGPGVLLSGTAGVGKTRLARAALAELERDSWQVRWVAATESSRAVPLAAFAPFVGALSADPLRRTVEVVRGLLGDPPADHCVVAIDDAHLLDKQSVLVLQHVIRDSLAPVVLTVRSGALPPGALEGLHGGVLIECEILPLDLDDVSRLLELALDGVFESASAQRFLNYTGGNMLFLNQLVEDELAAGRLLRTQSLWVWNGPGGISVTLRELIESRIGRQGAAVLGVLDLLALDDPVEYAVLEQLSDSQAIEDAVAAGLITVDEPDGWVRMAHPLFAEVRRARAGEAHLRRLRAQLAAAITSRGEPAPLLQIRRALLYLDADAEVDPMLLIEAAAAAMQLLDPDLSATLALAAAEHGAGRPAQEFHAAVLAFTARAEESVQLLKALAASSEDPAESARVALLMAVNLTWNHGRPLESEATLDARMPDAAACGLTIDYLAARASFRAAAGDPGTALRLANDALGVGQMAGVPTMLALGARVIAHGELGNARELEDAAARAYEWARFDPQSSHVRFTMGMFHLVGLRLSGLLDEAPQLATDLRSQSRDVAFSLTLTATTAGLAAMMCGDLRSARTWFREALATGHGFTDERSVARFAGQWLAVTSAMAGNRREAEEALTIAEEWPYPGMEMWGPDLQMARAWVLAVGGGVQQACEQVIRTADTVRAQGRPAHEVLCLQTLTQLGRADAAARLRELTVVVGGPRVVAAAAHAAALRGRDPMRLLAAAEAYGSFGDRVAAADATAQAATLFFRAGRVDEHRRALSVARELADECGLRTPAFIALLTPGLTERQRHVAALAAAGLSNAEIAEQLVMSTRTVEGHILKAVQRAGVGTRAELIALFGGR